MSDERLRQLERAWRESGAPEDEAAWLRERLRVDDLSADRLEIAAYCGHPAARIVLPDTEDGTGLTAEEWVRGLVRRSVVACALAAVVAAESVIDHWDEHHPGDPRPRRALVAVRTWLQNPVVGKAQYDALDLAEHDADDAWESVRGHEAGTDYIARTAVAAACAASWAASDLVTRGEPIEDEVGTAIMSARFWHPDRDAGVRSAMIAAIVPWALARADATSLAASLNGGARPRRIHPHTLESPPRSVDT